MNPDDLLRECSLRNELMPHPARLIFPPYFHGIITRYDHTNNLLYIDVQFINFTSSFEDLFNLYWWHKDNLTLP